MRKIAKVFRFIIAFIAIIEIIGGSVSLINGSANTGQTVGVVIVWCIVLAAVMYFERRSDTKPVTQENEEELINSK